MILRFVILQGEQATAIARYTVAVDRRFRRDSDEPDSRFYRLCSFRHVRQSSQRNICVKGIKIALTGRIQTGSYTNRDGQKVYTTDVVVEEQEFAESKAASAEHSRRFCTGTEQSRSPSNAVRRWFYEYSGRN